MKVPYQYVAVSTKTGMILDDLPAHQFNHVFIRAEVDGDWVYMDAASSISPFGSAPAWCQGTQAMVLDGTGTIITIPSDRPSQNALTVSETFTGMEDGWLAGRFAFEATGHTARQVSERWKVISLSFNDSRQAAQEGLRNYVPHAMVTDHKFDSDTGSSNLFRVTGSHRRCPLISLEKNPRRIGRLTWEVPTLPIHYWRMLEIGRLFSVEFPIRIDLYVRLEGEAFLALEDMSRAPEVENGVCRIEETISEYSDAVRIHRSIVFKKKFIQGAEVELVPHTLEEIEKALQLVMAFRVDERAPTLLGTRVS